jgi:transposase
MTCNEFRNHLADHLGGEAAAGAEQALRRHAETCGECRDELAGLELALATLEQSRLTRAQAEQRVSQTPRAISLAPALLRYAAVIALAFGGGYAVRGMRSPAATPAPAHVAPAVQPAELASRYVAASSAYPRASSLTHALLAIAPKPR